VLLLLRFVPYIGEGWRWVSRHRDTNETNRAFVSGLKVNVCCRWVPEGAGSNDNAAPLDGVLSNMGCVLCFFHAGGQFDADGAFGLFEIDDNLGRGLRIVHDGEDIRIFRRNKRVLIQHDLFYPLD
jgi:hypothetical protein